MTAKASVAPGSSRIMIIDSNLLTAEAIVVALAQRNFGVQFIVSAGTGDGRDLLGWDPDLAVIDIDSVSNAACIDCITHLNAAGVPVAVMGGNSNPYLVGQCLLAGASTVVDKSSPLNDLLEAIVRLLKGEEVLGQDERRRLAEPYQREIRARSARLTPFDVLTFREKCVLSELMEGNNAETIAQKASVSISTVRSQIKAILQKLGVNSQLAAVGLARQAEWSLGAADTGGRSKPKPKRSSARPAPIRLSIPA